MVSQPTKVFFTIDTEAAEERVVNGQLQRPQGYKPRIWGRFANRRRELGIRALMSTFERYDFRATFYLEALAHRYFGVEGLRTVCDTLLGNGHDVQLHLHPNFRRMAPSQSNEEPLPSLFNAYSYSEQVEMLEEGLDTLVACGVPRRDLISFRAGDYAANADTWKAMLHCGLSLSSSYNLCYRGRGCEVADHAIHAGPFAVAPGLVELPISTFQEGGHGYRHLQISAVSEREMVRTLCQSHQAGLRAVTLVTHPFEFFHVDPKDPAYGWPNPIAWRRLRGLLAFLDQNRERFQVATVGSLTPERAAELCRGNAEISQGSPLLRRLRGMEQAVQALVRRRELGCVL